MANLLDLPHETLIEIFCRLEDFDDVFQLGRCCRRLRLPVEDEVAYKIITYIIVSNNTSKFLWPAPLIHQFGAASLPGVHTRPAAIPVA